MYYKREIESVLLEAASEFRVVVLTGARQTGKSTLLEHLFKKSHRYVSLDDSRALRLAQEEPGLFFEQYPPPLILDEIQYAPELLSSIKLRVDRTHKKGQFLLTGSQQFTMMRNLQETLAGRAALFQLLPMSLTEGRAASKSYQYRALIGSYPELVVPGSIIRSDGMAPIWPPISKGMSNRIIRLRRLLIFEICCFCWPPAVPNC